MPPKKRESSKETSLRVGKISGISCNMNFAGRNITTHNTLTGLSAAEINQLFDGLYTKAEIRANTPTADKEDLKADVKRSSPPQPKLLRRIKKLRKVFFPAPFAI